MSILTSGLPTAIEIDDKIYDINADYQTAIKIITAFEDNSLADIEKSLILIDLLYKEPPPNLQEALEKGIKFLDCGDAGMQEDSQDEETERRYSFSYDEKYIFSGVDRVLNGRLSKGDFVHFWEFVMAFMELPEDCTMSKIIYYRTQKAKGKLTKEERQIYAENRKLFELPISLTSEEENAKDKFMEMLGK